MSEPGKSNDAAKPLPKMYKYSPSLPRRVLAHAYHFLQEKKMFTSLTISSPSKNVFYQRSPPPGGWENTFFERRRKYELSEHFLLLKKMLGVGYHLTSNKSFSLLHKLLLLTHDKGWVQLTYWLVLLPSKGTLYWAWYYVYYINISKNMVSVLMG